MRDAKSLVSRLRSRVGHDLVLPMVDRLVAHAPWRIRDHLFRELAVGLGVSTVTCDGLLGRFEGDARDEMIHAFYLATKTWAPDFLGIVRDHLFAREAGTLLDVGANIGLTSIPVANARGTTCHAFEPDPTNFSLLVRNIAQNDATARVHPQNVAIMDSEGQFEFERSKDNMGDHRIRIGGAPRGAYAEDQRTVISVPARTLDACVPSGLAHPVVLKSDVQGADARVFRGAARVLAEVDVIFVEYWPYGLRRLGDSPDALFESLGEFAYGAIVLGGKPPKLVPQHELRASIERQVPSDGSAVDHVDLVLARTPAL